MASFVDRFSLSMQEKLEIKEYIMLNEDMTNAEVSIHLVIWSGNLF